jgi:NDP-sugar pyrophosphorylase family protein
MDKLYVLKTAGSLVQTENGIDKDFVVLYIDGVYEPTDKESVVREVALVIPFDEAVLITYGLHKMFYELGRGEEFREAVKGTVTRQTEGQHG